jgi:hypothetical protein
MVAATGAERIFWVSGKLLDHRLGAWAEGHAQSEDPA